MNVEVDRKEGNSNAYMFAIRAIRREPKHGISTLNTAIKLKNDIEYLNKTEYNQDAVFLMLHNSIEELEEALKLLG
jgi:hypothetical protein